MIYPGREYIEINQKAIPCYNISAKPKHGKIRLFTEDKNSQPPITEHQDTSGLILTAAYDVDIPAKSRRLVYTGLKCEIPTGTVGWVTGLSGLAISKMIDVTPMILDTSYHGQISLIVHNHNDKTYTLKAGDRIVVLTFGLQSTAQIDLPKTQSVTPKIHLKKNGSIHK